MNFFSNIYNMYNHLSHLSGRIKNLISMATSQELFEQMKELFAEFEENHNATTKAGKSRARKAIGEIKKLVTDYRKASVEENK